MVLGETVSVSLVDVCCHVVCQALRGSWRPVPYTTLETVGRQVNRQPEGRLKFWALTR
jgi:hypothetical protein